MKKVIGIVLAGVGGILWLTTFFVDFFPFDNWVGFFMFLIGGYIAQNAESDDTKVRGIVKLMIGVAALDGEVSDDELKHIESYAHAGGLTDQDLEKIVDEFRKGDDKFRLPDTQSAKEDAIRQIVKLAKADGEIHPNEKAFIRGLASQLNVSESFVNKQLGQ